MSVVPDSIEALEQWRTWAFNGTALVSHNTTVWKPGEPMHATCAKGEGQVWTIKRGGMSREDASKHAGWHNQHAVNMNSLVIYSPPVRHTHYLNHPHVEPPDGYGYALETVQHNAPSADCTCGIYAGSTPADCPSGDVLGKVKLWGTVVPGDKGARAEYAYPSELHVPAKWAEHPALLAYGVPIVSLAAEELPQVINGQSPTRSWTTSVAIALNLSAFALNMAIVAWRLV